MTATTTDPRRGQRWFRLNLWLHRWTSLIATLPFLVLCVTGSVLIFHDEINQAMGVIPKARQTAASNRPLADSVARVLATHPGMRPINVALDEDQRPGTVLVGIVPKQDHGFARAVASFTERATATPLSTRDLDKTFTGILLNLHSKWFLGPKGELVGATVALLVLLSLLSGLVVYAPYVKRLAFGMVRRGRGTRLLQLDLHNFIGVLVLGWAIAVTVTGLLLGFGSLALAHWRNTELASVQTAYAGGRNVDLVHPPVDIDHVFRAAISSAPVGWEVAFAIYPDTEFSAPTHFTVMMHGGRGVQRRVIKVALVNAATGRVDAVRQLPWYLKAVVISQPLHFGDYGGLPLKILWSACAWMTLFITGNGAWLWWSRRGRRRLGPVEAAG